MATITPDRSLEQRRVALQSANRIRIARAAVKESVRCRQIPVADLLMESPEFLSTMKVFELMKAMPAWGPTKINSALNAVKVRPNKTVGGLSARQREELIALISSWDTRRLGKRTRRDRGRLDQLRKANEARVGTRDVRREISSRELTPEEAVNDPRAGALTVHAFLLAFPRWGKWRADRVLATHKITGRRRIRQLTERQRGVLVEELGGSSR